MSDAVIISLIGGAFGLAGMIISGWNNFRLGKLNKQTNHMKDELMALTRKDAKAEGNLEGRAELKDEQKSK